MRLIDADKLTDEFEDTIGNPISRTRLKLQVQNQPTIDAVEVMRRPVVGYEGYYEVDQFGRVFAIDRVVHVSDNGREYDKPLEGRQMKQSLHTKGYKTVSLTRDGHTKTMYVHRVVAEAFIPNPNNYPFINHKDEDKTNNFVENLEWCTNEYNVNYGKGKERRVKKIRGRALSEEHKKKISDGVKRYHRERKTNDSQMQSNIIRQDRLSND